jgi:hypothetical protein
LVSAHSNIHHLPPALRLVSDNAAPRIAGVPRFIGLEGVSDCGGSRQSVDLSSIRLLAE